MYIDKKQLFKNLGEELGVSLTLDEGEAIIKEKSGRKIHIESPKEADFFLFYTTLYNKPLEDISDLERKIWLSTNGEFSGPGWVGYNQEDQSLQFFSPCAIHNQDPTPLVDTFKYVVRSANSLTSEVEGFLKEVDKKGADKNEKIKSIPSSYSNMPNQQLSQLLNQFKKSAN
ncbi:CesT family type III secretion system chaperone [Agarilytica rhodophyticola]|uniref:CesT family type III secretion system chaperone n=1 Tax=Agarilytica rhodophyticola TaxID=1737490 RepID=UPI000B349BF9